MKCELCNTGMIWEEGKVYTSIPPMYGYICPKCGHVQYSRIPNEQCSADNNMESKMTEFEKQVSNIILSWKGDSNYLYLDEDHQIETLKKQCELILSYAKKELGKDLPKWKKATEGKEFDRHVLLFENEKRVVLTTELYKGDYYIELDSLKTLPKEE